MSIYKSIVKLSLSINQLSSSISSKKENNSHYYTNEKTDKKDDMNNVYEEKIILSTMESHGKIFNNPTVSSGVVISSNAQDDDLNDISEQLKGMNKNGR